MFRRYALLALPWAALNLTACQGQPVQITTTSTTAVSPGPVAGPAADAPAPQRWLTGVAAEGETAFQSADLKVYGLGQKKPIAVGLVGADNSFKLEVPADLPEGTLLLVVATKGDKSVAGLAIAPSGGNVVAPGGANVVAAGGDNVVSPGGGNVVSPGGGNVVSPGGGNVVSPGGGNVVSPGGGNVIAPGGGNVIAPGGGNVVSPGGGNVIAPGGGNVIAPGGGNVIAPGGGNVVAPGGANVIAPGGANLTAGSTLAVGLLSGRFDAMGQAGLTSIGRVVAPGGANVIAPGGANVIAPGGANVVAAGGMNMHVLATKDPAELLKVVEAYQRLVEALDQAAKKLQPSTYASIFNVVHLETTSHVSETLAVALQIALPSVSSEFVDTVTTINEVLRQEITSGGSAPDTSLLGTITFGGVTGAPVLSNSSGTSSTPIFGGTTGPTPVPAPSPGTPIVSGGAQ